MQFANSGCMHTGIGNAYYASECNLSRRKSGNILAMCTMSGFEPLSGMGDALWWHCAVPSEQRPTTAADDGIFTFGVRPAVPHCHSNIS
jgi:hypothetical protein